MLLLPLLVLVSVGASSDTPLKCRQTVSAPGHEANKPVALIDGRIARPTADTTETSTDALRTPFEHSLGMADLNPEVITAIEVSCWHPDLDDFGMVEGGGLPVIRIFTSPAKAATRAPLEALIRAQTAHEETSGSYARRLEDLHAAGLPVGVELQYAATDEGWTASTPGGAVAWQCTASYTAGNGRDGEATATVGAGPVEGAERGAADEAAAPEITCDTADGLGLASLRELFESGG